MVAEANPFNVCPAAKICLISRSAVSFAGTVTEVPADTSFNNIVYVAFADAVFDTRIELIYVVVKAGTVYNVVLVVAAAPLNNTLNVFGINIV